MAGAEAASEGEDAEVAVAAGGGGRPWWQLWVHQSRVQLEAAMVATEGARAGGGGSGECEAQIGVGGS